MFKNPFRNTRSLVAVLTQDRLLTEGVFTSALCSPKNDVPKHILSENVAVFTDTDRTGLNNNVLVLGGPGTGKDRGLILPNLLEANGSYIVTDPSGALARQTGSFFKSKGYDVKVLDLCDTAHSNHFNPFAYADDGESIVAMVDSLIFATHGSGKTGSDPFWEDTMRALLLALVFYVKSFCPPSEQNLHQIAKMLHCPSAAGKPLSDLDPIFNEVREKYPDHICLKYYDIFRKADEATAGAVFAAAGEKTAMFESEPIAKLTAVDDLNLGSFNQKPTVLFIVIPQIVFGPLPIVSMVIAAAFAALYRSSDICLRNTGKKPGYNVEFILNEFANIGVIPSFEEKLSTMRRFCMSCWICLDSVTQLKNLYGKQSDTIVGDCSARIYLGSNDPENVGFVKELVGKNVSPETRKMEYAMTEEEISQMDSKNCIICVDRHLPMMDRKFNRFREDSTLL